MPEQKSTIRSIDGLSLDARLLGTKHPAISVLLVHGFGVDLHEEGTFDILAQRLFENNISVARFSFRGHGASAGTQDGMTISGERLDLTAAYRWMTSSCPPPYAILAASFGAVSTLLQLHALHPEPTRLVLWNPVLDLGAVFVDPATPWGRKNFGKKALRHALRRGYSIVDGSVRVGQVFLEEVQLHLGNLGLENLGNVPTLVIHGTKDSYVPIASSRRITTMSNVQLTEILNSDHGFPDARSEETAITPIVIVGLQRRHDRRQTMKVQLENKHVRDVQFAADLGLTVDWQDWNQSHIHQFAKRTFPWRMPESCNPWWNRSLKLGEIACTLTHWNVWTYAYERRFSQLCELADQCDALYQSSGGSAAMACARQSISLKTLNSALKSTHAAIRRRAIYIASLMPPGEAIASLSEVLVADECPVVRHEAAFCLGAFGDKRAINILTKAMLYDPNTLVRHEAAEALGDMGAEEARQALCIAKGDPCEAVRRTADK